MRNQLLIKKQISNIDQVKKFEADKHVISDMVQNSNEILMNITSVGFSFDFFSNDYKRRNDQSNNNYPTVIFFTGA